MISFTIQTSLYKNTFIRTRDKECMEIHLPKAHVTYLYMSLCMCRGPGPYSRSQCGRWELLASGRGAGPGASQALSVPGRIPRLGQAAQPALQQGEEAAAFIHPHSEHNNGTHNTFQSLQPQAHTWCSLCRFTSLPLGAFVYLQQQTQSHPNPSLCIPSINIFFLFPVYFYFLLFPYEKRPPLFQVIPDKTTLQISAHTLKKRC